MYPQFREPPKKSNLLNINLVLFEIGGHEMWVLFEKKWQVG